MLKTKVFLSSVTNLSDARYAAGMGVDYIGFNINPDSKHFVTPEQVKTINEWVSGVSVVHEIDDKIATELDKYGAGNVLTTNPKLVGELEQPVLKLDLHNYSISDLTVLLGPLKDTVSFFILEVLDISLEEISEQLNELCRRYSIYIATDFKEETLSTVLDTIQPEGIVLYGSEEIKPGLSSYDGIADILEQLELD